MAIVRCAKHELYDIEPTHRFNTIFSTINLESIWNLFEKNTNVGAPRELNYGAMVYSLIARVMERIATVKDIVKRLRNDPFLIGLWLYSLDYFAYL